MSYMRFIRQSSAIRFITKPNRLEFKYEKAMIIAIQKGMNSDFLNKFPKHLVKTAYICMS